MVSDFILHILFVTMKYAWLCASRFCIQKLCSNFPVISHRHYVTFQNDIVIKLNDVPFEIAPSSENLEASR
jgi:hypothetical protein